jgi:mono/diheme cytochrome c family protein
MKNLARNIRAVLAAAAILAAVPMVAQADDLVDRGHYLSLAADCMPCHTKPGGTPFAGGLILSTPFGTLSSPNITPDPDTGIGGWTDQQFYAAVHDGIGKGGEYLYPVMVFTSYTKMPRSDVMAILAYLRSLKPVYAPRAPYHMEFPFNVRTGMIAWRELFFRPGVFVPDPKESAVWNRGAYLVQGPGHCGECHSPRNILGATETDDSLSGGLVGHWLAPNISSDPKWGLGDWTIDQIVTFLKTGATKNKGVVFGPMAEVVHDSLSHLTDADVTAIATYLKGAANRTEPPQPMLATRPDLVAGQTIYMDNCAQCHQSKGVGIPGLIPNLAGNRAVQAAKPNDVIMAVLRGVPSDGHYIAMPSFAGALSDQNVADVVNYVRSGWGNQGPTDASPSIVASMRSVAGAGLAGTQASRAFDCPAVGNGVVPGVLADPAQVAFLANAQGTDLSNKIDELIANIQKNRPGIDDATLSDAMNAAYCPIIAQQTGLSYSQKRARLATFNSHLQERIAAVDLLNQPGVHVVVNVPLTQSVLQQVDAAAEAAKQPPQTWMADTLAKAAAK